MSRKVIDIESTDLLGNSLDYTSFPYVLKKDIKLHCVVVTDVDTQKVDEAVGDAITKEWLQDVLSDCTVLIAHNGVKFDFIVLWLFKVLDYKIGYPGEPSLIFGKKVQIVDTLILSRLFNPDRKGGHSLEAWGVSLGNAKTDFREECVKSGIIERTAPKGAEFKMYTPLMGDYCKQDTFVNLDVYKALLREWESYDNWDRAIEMETKLADLAVRRETFGFWFDKDLALWCLDDLGNKLKELTEKVNPFLPPKPMNKGELNTYTPPQRQLTKEGQPTSYLQKFAQNTGSILKQVEEDWILEYDDKTFKIPFTEPLKTEIAANIDDMDHVKMHLINLGWNPSEWRERDLTKDSKKQNLPYEKRIKALERWYKETIEGKYQKSRLKILGIKPHEIIAKLSKKLKEDKPVRVPTSPTVRVGVEKELCPNLISLGDKVSFAKDFALFLTYRSRKNIIAGGLGEDEEFDPDNVNTGFLSMYREEDGRIPTPAIEIGASTNRYTHIGVANIPRASSLYGKEMRSLFGAGKQGSQLGYDFSSLEARIQGHYCYKYTDGAKLAEQLLAEKPNDIHSLRAAMLDIKRDDAKSVNYMLLYGGQIPKVVKMLACSEEKGTEVFNGFWDGSPSLKELKTNLEKYWEQTGKNYILGIDGRKIMTRSKHSLLNALFQSAGIICAKYVTVYNAQQLEQKGYCIDPFIGLPDVCSMIEYHDEGQYFINNKNIKFKVFQTEEEAKEFIQQWNESDQLSAVTEGKTWYVALPNDLSIAIEKSIKKVEKELKLNVALGYEWVVNKNWYGCH